MKRAILLLVLLPLLAADLSALQQRPVADTAAADTVRRGISPGTAFWRSLLVPGWGQFSVGAEKRAVSFILIQGTSAFMLVKTWKKLSEARDVEERRVGAARDSLNALMARDTAARRRLSDEPEFEAAIDSTEGVQRVRRLIASREQQRQDWITYTLVSTLASGIDAFVAAHLRDFPATVDANARRNGALELQIGVPLRRRR